MPPRPPLVSYAVVGLGHIAQVAVLPAFRHARDNSRLAALVSGDATKRRALSRKHRVRHAFSYDDYDECLQMVDAVYLALPNHLHAEYAIRAAQAGVHVLCEKPLAVTAEECERMIAACEEAGVHLMVAYRLHFEALNLEAIDLVRRGRIGEPRFFNASFAMTVRQGDIRARRDYGGGTLYDIGVYCINAARALFRAEPTEVLAMSVHSGAKRLTDVDETTAAVLRFDDGRIASFVTSFKAAGVGTYQIVGAKGHLRLDPAFKYAEPLAWTLTVGDRVTRKRVGKHDQFAAQLAYFSDCIQRGRSPEPSGADGLQDVRIIEALYESAETGKAVALRPYVDRKRPTLQQRITKPPVGKARLVKVKSPS